jgi:predicted MFS family arabinose efflux permease
MIKEMFKLFAKLLTIVFVISAFLFVMIEQGIMTWLPTFNDKVHLPENISIMMASILAISLAVGRLVAGVITKKKLDMGSQLLYRYGNVSCGFVLPKRWA